MKNNMKILLPTMLGSLAIGAGVGAYVFPTETVTEKVIMNNSVVKVPVEVIKNVTVEKEVMVDNGNLDSVLQQMYDNKGNVSYLTDGLKDSEVNKIADRVVFVNDVKSMAINETESGIIKELNNIKVGNVTLNSFNIERLRINSSFDQINIKNIDFGYNDATVEVAGQFEQNNTRYNFVSEVKFVDNKFDKIFSVSVN